MLSVYLSFGGFMVLILAIIALAISAVLVPSVRANITRISSLTMGAVMAMSGIVGAMFTTNAENFWFAAMIAFMGCSSVLQGVYAHNRRARGIIGGASLILVGLGFAGACLNPDDIVRALRYYFLGSGELLVIMGVVLVTGAWQGWLLPLMSFHGD